MNWLTFIPRRPASTGGTSSTSSWCRSSSTRSSSSFAARAPSRWRLAAPCSSGCSTARSGDISRPSTGWFATLAGYLVFALIVLFQSDIRRALAHLGRAPFFRYFADEKSAEESIEELVVAAGMLSRQRIGAIIAIERQIGLRNYIEGGIPLDAVLTYDLLVSIFQPSSPLHDGAVIVQERPRGRGGLLSAAHGQSEAQQGARLAPSRGHRTDRGKRLGRDRRV